MRLVRIVVSFFPVVTFAAGCATAVSHGISQRSRPAVESPGFSTRPDASHGDLPGPCRDAFDPTYVSRECR